jgi:tetratricopeptide (TPR) repeat protein
MDRTSDAVQRLRSAADRDPARHKELIRLADWAEEIGDHESYDHAVEIMIRQFPNWHVGYGYQFETLKREARQEDSIESLRRSLECYSDYDWALEQLMRVHLDAGEPDAAIKAIHEFAGNYSASLTLSYDLQISVARDDSASFIQSVLACELTSGELRRAVEFARERFTLQKNLGLLESLRDRMDSSEADERIGLAWGTLMSSEELFDVALGQLGQHCDSPAWHAAVRELMPAIDDFGEGDDAIAVRKRALARMMKIATRHIHNDPNTWAAAIWAFLEVKDFGSARRIAASYEKAQPQYANSLLSSMLASLYDYQVRLLHEIATRGRRISQEQIIDDVQVVFAIEAVLRRDLDLASRHLALVALPGELTDWYSRLYRLLKCGIRGVHSGDETELIRCFETKFTGEQPYFIRMVFYRLRCAIAKRHRGWWKYVCTVIGLRQ